MRQITRAAALLGAALAAGGAAAECGIEAGSVRILSNDFPAVRIVNGAASECASDGVTVTANATTEHKNIQGPALSIDPAEYTVAVVANNSIVPLLNDDLIRPLDDLLAEYGQGLPPTQLIGIDGQVMAVAFMGNSQHLFYRQDILDEAGLEPPRTYEEMFAAAEAIRAAGLMEYPLAAAVKPGWDLAAEFVNLYLGTGAELFEPGTAELAIDGEEGRLVLDTMRAMTQYMDPDYLTFDANEMSKVWDAGRIALMNQWGSLAGAAIGPAADPEVARNTKFAATPTIGDGAIPAAALWWDGFAVASNVSDEDAAASFRAMVHGIDPSVVAANPDAAAWLTEGYEPTPAAEGVMANAQGGARPYPMEPYMGLLHSALSAELADFIAGREDAEDALADVEAAYSEAARAAGFL